MIKNDGGKGDIKIIYPAKLGIWSTLLSGQADSTWIFDNWEGIEAEGKNIALNKFFLDDFHIPYGYSPIVITKKENLIKHKIDYTNFIKAIKKGFLFVKDNLNEAATTLKSYVTKYDFENIDIEKTISFTQPYFGDESNCGKMKDKRVYDFLNWLVKNGLENEGILKQSLLTNELLV